MQPIFSMHCSVDDVHVSNIYLYCTAYMHVEASNLSLQSTNILVI